MSYYVLDKICEINKGKQIDTDLLDDANEYKYINGGINHSGYYSDFNTEGETIIISEGGASCGYVNYIDEKFWCGCHCYKLTNCKFPVKYMYYALKGNQEKIMALRTGAAMPNINKKNISLLEIKLTDNVQEQDKIINILDKITDLIDKHNLQLEKLDELIKARFVEVFGYPVLNKKGWDVLELSTVLNVVGGYAFKSDKFKKIGVPVLRIGNINTGHFLPVNMVYWENDDKLNQYKIFPGDLVMSLTGTVGKDDYGNVCILNDDYPMYYLNQRNAKLELSESINKYYLSALLKFEDIKKKLTGISRGVRQANISNKDILNLSVPIPPIEIQNQFADFILQVDKQKTQIQKKLEKLEMLKKALMQKYFG